MLPPKKPSKRWPWKKTTVSKISRLRLTRTQSSWVRVRKSLRPSGYPRRSDPELIVEGAAAEAVIEAATDEIVVGQDAGDAEIVIEGEPAAESLTPVAPADSVVTAVEADRAAPSSRSSSKSAAEPVAAATLNRRLNRFPSIR